MPRILPGPSRAFAGPGAQRERGAGGCALFKVHKKVHFFLNTLGKELVVDRIRAVAV